LLTLVCESLEKAPEKLSTANQEKKKKILNLHCQVFDKSNITSKAGVESFISQYPTIVDFLEEFCALLCSKLENENTHQNPLLSLAQMIMLLPRLQTRYYSISSSPKDDPSKVSITVGVLNTKTSAGVRLSGVCSNYIARLRPMKDRVRFSIRKSSFRGPTKLSSPVIMIGAGTGLAPMMGFLSDREHEMNAPGGSGVIGGCHLFFGCRTEEERLYPSTIDHWEQTQVLKHHLALSREPNSPKTYVQDLLDRFGAELCQLLMQSDTHYYICGDSKVADYCFESCVNALRKHGKMSRVSAVQHIKFMRSQGRWQYDLWGIISHFNDAKRDVRKKKQATAKTWLLNFS